MNHWSTSLFVDNLTNKQAHLDDVTALSANIPTHNRIATNQPRAVGIENHYENH